MEQHLKFDTYFDSEEKIIRDTVRQWAAKQERKIATAFEEGKFPLEFVKQLGSLGILGMTLPAEYGAEASYTAYGLVCQELEYIDSSLRSFISVQSSLVMYPIYKYGTIEQKKNWLPKLQSGEAIGCFGLTEPDSGSDPAGMRTFANKVKGGWEISGSKMWITNATIADIALIWANTDTGVRGFLVPKNSKGFTTLETKHKLSLRASVTGELVLDKCYVPDANLMPGTDKGLSCALSCLSEARYGISWGAIGAARACYDCALDYVKNRKQGNTSLASKQLIQHDLADIITAISIADSFNVHLARLKDKNECHYSAISMAKLNSCRVALNAARTARNLLGASGISLEYPVIRHMNNLESVYTYEGTDNIHHLIIGREITGYSAF